MKRNAIIRIVCYSVMFFVLLSFLVAGIGIGQFSFYFNLDSGTTVTEEVSFDAASIQKIEIDWAAGSVDLRVGDTDKITVIEVMPEDCKYQMTYKLSGDTLKLSYSDTVIGIGIGNWSAPSKGLIITVPADWVCKELEIDGAALDITMQAVTIGQLELDGAACSLNFAGSLDKLDIDGASTEAHLECLAPLSQVNMDGASCDLEIILPGGYGFYAKLNGLSCKFRSDLDYTMRGDAYCYGDEYCLIKADGVSCTVTVLQN